MRRSRNNDEPVRLQNVVCTVATNKAILCEIENEEIWIPLSQVDDESEVHDRGDEGELVITRWIAEQKGLV